MAQTFSYTAMYPSGRPGAFSTASSVNASKSLICEITGPVTSVSSGMTIGSITTDMDTHIYGGKLLGSYQTTALSTFGVHFLPSSTYSSAGFKIQITRLSTMANCSSAVDLSGYSWVVELIGY